MILGQARDNTNKKGTIGVPPEQPAADEWLSACLFVFRKWFDRHVQEFEIIAGRQHPFDLGDFEYHPSKLNMVPDHRAFMLVHHAAGVLFVAPDDHIAHRVNHADTSL
jgi:hypothetical protein